VGKILSLENGKTLAEAIGEVSFAAAFIKWFGEEAPRNYGDVIPSSLPNTTVFTLKQPVGVCGIITPWNFPAAMITRKIAPAFAAGCSVVIKPPSETPYSCLAFVKLAVQAGIPADCVHVVPTKDREAATELATNPLVRKISFTGSTGVGKMLTKLAAGTMKKVSMELGGNAPFIVFEDANLKKAVEGQVLRGHLIVGAIFCKFRNSGQTCICANRLFVHEKIYDEFAQLLKEEVAKFKLGFGLDTTTTQGPLVNASAVTKVLEHVTDAKKKGAQVLIGGKAPEHLKGFFFEPTILTNVTTEMVVSKDETFGPLAPLFKFSSDQEVIDMANDTEFGLAGYFFSQDVNRVWRVASAMECGMIGVNTGKISAVESPFGGVTLFRSTDW
jgi:succinate-semialdehyde dehydrogenase / glutarate-semialdehyde dehydrogenase